MVAARRWLLGGTLPVLIALAAAMQLMPTSDSGPRIERVTVHGNSFDVVRAKPERIEMRWKNDAGKLLRDFANLESFYREHDRRVLFATNAGIYEPDGTPAGLFVEDGTQHVPLNEKQGDGNFYLQPNGVFYVSADSAGVATTAEMSRRGLDGIRFATQSGPMLVIDGQINPAFNAESDSKKIRSGVGIDPTGGAVFVLSADRINFHAFATFFRDSLQCRNALFLDGEISRFHEAGDQVPRGQNFAAMIAVVD